MSDKKAVAKRALRSLHAFLVKHLDPSIVHDFFSESLLTEAEVQKIEAEATQMEKNSRLLDSLRRRADEAKVLDAMITFLEGEDGDTKETNEQILRKIEKAYPFYSYDKMETDDTSKGAAASQQIDRGSFTAPVNPVSIPSLPRPNVQEKPRNISNNLSLSSVGHVKEDPDGLLPLGAYPIRSLPRGLCVIINNEHFHDMKDRSGTNWDASALEDLFGSFLGFHIEKFKDLTSVNMMQVMENVRDYDHSKLSCLAVCILSHGINGEIYGTDGKLVRVETITHTFVGTQCPTLAGKPKLFFLQACRGGTFDHGVTVEQTDSGTKEVVKVDEILEEDETDGGGYKMALPNESDFLLAYATTPGFVSWRNSAFGTWFVKAFTDTMRERAGQDHLMDILVEVNRKVAEEYHSREHKKQMPQPVNMLRYKLYLPPV